MNNPKNLTEAVLYAIQQNWLIIILVIVIPIGYAILMRKFEKWAEGKIRSFKGKKVKKK